MLARRHRFHGQNGLLAVYRRGTTVRSTGLTLRYVRNPQRKEYRLAVIVSRKVDKSAVRRNRMRRRVFEIVRTGPEISQPYDLVLTVLNDRIATYDPEKLTTEVRILFRRAHIYESAVQVGNRSDRGIVKDTKGLD